MKRIANYLLTATALLGAAALLTFAAKNDFGLARNMETLVNMMRELSVYYVDEVDADRLMTDAAEGMVRRLDPYTVYMPEEEMTDFQFLTTGKYGGVGALIRKKGDGVVVAQPYKGFPADRAGLQIGDRFVEIAGKDARGMTTEQVSALLKGTPNTNVTIKVEKLLTGQVEEVKLRRERIAISGVGYVQPGDVKFVDINHDGRVNELDKTDLGNGIPDFTMGFNLGFNWKGLDFSVVANGAFGQQIVQSYRNHTSKQANYTTAILGRWTGEGTSNRIPRVTDQNLNWQFSDLYVQDGDYLRISNITLGYDFAKLLRCKVISQCRIYAQVQNAFTFTKYDGMDPEIGYGPEGDNGQGWVSGVDLGYYPRPRTVLFGVNLKF